MNVVFQDAVLPDLAPIVEVLKDDQIGVERETSELSLYQKAFTSLLDASKTQCVVGEIKGEIKGRVVAYDQVNVIDGLSHTALRRW